MRFQKYVCMEQRLIVNSVLDPVTGCWNWIAARDKRASTPYGKISVFDSERGKPVMRQAHIVSYETFIGPVPPGHQIDHECRNGFCICPNHLNPLLPVANLARRGGRFKHTAKSTTYVGELLAAS